MNILVTGANGFIGKNLCATLEATEDYKVLKVTKDTSKENLSTYLKECDFVFHLAGVNRPNSENEYIEGNVDFTRNILNELKERNIPIVFTSSIQADRNNAYGKSKLIAEKNLLEHSNSGSPVYIYRLKNIFGKWSKPNYNSVVATFCHNISRDIPIVINDDNYEVDLCYIDDVIKEFLNALKGHPTLQGNYCIVPKSQSITLRELANTLYNFRNTRDNLAVENMSDRLTHDLYSTYLSFLPENQFNYYLKMNKDHRGSFTEFIKTKDRGQVSINISRPGIIKGNHWHHSKNEKFLVVSGHGIIRFRKIGEGKIIEYNVSDKKMEVIDIPTGYVHNIENTGKNDLVTVMWANEVFNSDRPDTYHQQV